MRMHIRTRAGRDALFKIRIFAVMTKSQSTSYAFKTRPTVCNVDASFSGQQIYDCNIDSIRGNTEHFKGR